MTGHRDTATEPRRPFDEPVQLDLAEPDTLRHLWDLQRAAYAVEARLIGFDGIPALHESLKQLRACDESFLGVCDESEQSVGFVCRTALWTSAASWSIPPRIAAASQQHFSTLWTRSSLRN
ncbi:hypothetical protein [Streptomyces sp. NPDC006879]|uniref:hypothetical protein n=1 Tax=Streptomyces sp. NPDC006879 TaxID=3364767 RepID=UPI0036938CCC